MENQEVLKSIAVLADKTGRYHERLMAVERDNLRLEKELKDHKNGCSCSSPKEELGVTVEKQTQVHVDNYNKDDDCPSCGA